MKKIYSKLTAAMTAAVAAAGMCQAFPASAAENIRLMGDMNGDLKITALDAQLALNIYADAIVEIADNIANEENGNADIDMDGEIDALDAQKILLYYCQTLVGDQPLWAEFRDVSYHDGLDYMPLGGDPDDGNDPFHRTQNDTPFEMKGMYLEVGCAQGAPGETVTVPVYIAGAADLIGMVMFIDPPEGLEPVSITSNLGKDFELPFATQFGTEPYTTYLPKGSIVFAEVDNIHPQDGYVIANYSYKIPEDAQPGTVYPVCVNTAKTEFGGYFEEETDYDLNHDGEISDEEYMAELLGENSSFKNYQYTLLNGVVVVN